MSITKIRFIFLTFALSLPIIASPNVTLEQAEVVFNQRGQGIKAIKDGKKMFLSLLEDKHQPLTTRQKAFDRYARLSVLQAELGKEKNHIKNPVKIFTGCLDASENLNPKTVNKMTQEYVYWRSICIGLWASHASVAQIVMHLGRVTEFKSLIKYGLEHFETFDSYGFHRLYAGMYLRSKALTMLNLYHPEKALGLIDVPISKGTTIYLDYLLKAEAMSALGHHQEAISLLAASIIELKQQIVDKKLPSDITVESEYFLVMMEQALSAWI